MWRKDFLHRNSQRDVSEHASQRRNQVHAGKLVSAAIGSLWINAAEAPQYCHSLLNSRLPWELIVWIREFYLNYIILSAVFFLFGFYNFVISIEVKVGVSLNDFIWRFSTYQDKLNSRTLIPLAIMCIIIVMGPALWFFFVILWNLRKTMRDYK